MSRARGLSGAFSLPPGTSLVEASHLATVGEDGFTHIVDTLLTQNIQITDFPRYQARVTLHAIVADERPVLEVAEAFDRAVGLFVLPMLSRGTWLDPVKLHYRVGGRAGQLWGGSGPSGNGSSPSQPLPGAIGCPWRWVPFGKNPRRQGRTWWPGLGSEFCDVGRMVMQGRGLVQWREGAVSYANELAFYGVVLVIANPRLDGPNVWPIELVSIDSKLRGYERRRYKQQQAPSIISGALGISIPSWPGPIGEGPPVP